MSGEGWKSTLERAQSGQAKATWANVAAILQHDPLYGPDTLWRDTFLGQTLRRSLDGSVHEWSDLDDTRTCIDLQERYAMSQMPVKLVSDLIAYVASQREKHCFLDGLPEWDDEPRIDSALETYWGVESSERQSPSYIRAVSRNLFLCLAARLRRPGCQVDNMVVLEGPQGIGKSKSLRILGREHYMVAQYSVTTIDFFRSTRGKAVLEVGELDAFSKGERERIKLAISTPTDRYREPHARRAIDVPRQYIMVGTTNHQQWGGDETGLRRFWPVAVGVIDCTGLESARDQLLAEGLARVDGHEPWWHTPPTDTLQVQAERNYEDIWTPVVLAYLSSATCPEHPTTAEILRGALGMRDVDMTRVESNRISSIMTPHGWKSQTIYDPDKRYRGWKRQE